ncbi:LysR substrate-binding domain-containing protein [Aminobacter anthyllidis]|uniref:LysR substrate-binding domain-containing protein n=1 Tax=Aminobacter anthyllidis TaxID=1035067 RepID=UPI002455731D|nr:LysR substrate-binding domain-containing protein [Aminobacter anthyllidis]MDH4987920.1 LysR substrate-binding domain-containing protein [Aminobacter anthyllidis]
MTARLDSDLLRTFLAVAESGNFTRAAEGVGRTQSAISMQIKRLEEVVGGVLFERGARGVTLTERGTELVGNARRIVALLDETASSMRAAPLGGPVRIGIPEEYGQPVLSRALGAFAKRHSQVEITVRFGYSVSQLAALAAGELDLAVVFEWQQPSGAEVLMSDPTVWVASLHHHLHLERPLPIAMYTRHGWSREYALRSLEQRGIDYRFAYTSDTTNGLTLAVTAGLALAPMARSNIPVDCRELTDAEGFGQIDTTRVVMHRNPRANSEAVDAMADAIRDAFHQRR